MLHVHVLCSAETFYPQYTLNATTSSWSGSEVHGSAVSAMALGGQCATTAFVGAAFGLPHLLAMLVTAAAAVHVQQQEQSLQQSPVAAELTSLHAAAAATTVVLPIHCYHHPLALLQDPGQEELLQQVL